MQKKEVCPKARPRATWKLKTRQKEIYRAIDMASAVQLEVFRAWWERCIVRAQWKIRHEDCPNMSEPAHAKGRSMARRTEHSVRAAAVFMDGLLCQPGGVR